MTGPFRRPALPFAAGLGMLLLLCWLGGRFGLIGARPLVLPGTTAEIPAGVFILLYAATWGGGLLLLLVFPRQLTDRQAFVWIVVIALAARLLLAGHPPSDDLNRYLWEGRLLREGISPYHFAPEHPALAALAAADPWHAGINHPAIPAAYPPLILLLFAAVGAVGYHPLAVKLLMIGCDLATLVLVLQLLRHRGLPLRWGLLYAVNPLVLYAFAGQGHFDAVSNLLLCAAVVLYERRAWGWMFLLAGLAVQSKYVAAPAVGFLLRRDNLKFAWIAVAAVLLPFVPFASGGLGPVFKGLLGFGGAFAFNGPVHDPLRRVLGGIAPATAACGLAFAFIYLGGLGLFHLRLRPRHGVDAACGVFFALATLIVLSPTVHFWYLTWVIAFVALRPSASWIALSLTAAGYFATLGVYHTTGAWRLPLWAQVLEWLPFGILLTRELGVALRRWAARTQTRQVHSVSVIVPAINEADCISACVGSALSDAAVCEVIVVDGGSTDGTVGAARKAGAAVYRHRRPPEAGGGRGGQVLAGLCRAAGDVVAVVHADTRVSAGGFSQILRTLQCQPTVVGGALGGVFAGRGVRLRLLEIANDFRSALLGIHFGDQVQFFRRRPVLQHRLYPSIPLMEDVELSLRLRRLGRQVYLFGAARISSRRWQTGGWGRAFLIISLTAEYLLRRCCGRSDPLAMYRRYYP